jgi:Ca-activated chloride channel family protein
VVSDGVPTVGLTDSTRIIEAFSETNRGAVSVFTLGTYLGANAYLLDLLSYRNRGDTHIVPSDRWRIPDDLERRAREISRPVLADVRFRFAGQSACEVYPVLTSNLYLDRPLVLYGRYPRDVSRLIFQAVGQAGDVPCDMVFDLDLSRAPGGEKSIRTLWAWQKVYHLIGEHTRTRNPAMPEAIRQVAHTYGIRVPYAEELAP